jgi:hypothetical protein
LGNDGTTKPAKKAEDDLPKKLDEDPSRKDASALNQSISKSPQKSLAIKGPPKVINEKLDIDNYQGVKVMDINVRPLNQSVAQIRAQKEMSSIASQQKLGTSSIGDIGSSGLNHMGMGGASQSNSQYVAGMTGGAGGQTNPADASRILSAETINDKQ